MIKKLIYLLNLIKKKKQRHDLLVRKAWDYTHLAYVWDIPLLSDDPKLWKKHNDTFGSYNNLEDIDVKFIQDFLNKVLEDHMKLCIGQEKCHENCKIKQVSDDLRLYLKNLGNSDISYWGPVWIGISQIEEGGEETLLKAAIPLIGHMWD